MSISAKKIASYILLSMIVIISAAIIIVPRLIDFDAIKEKVATRLSHDLGSEVGVNAVQIHWFPLPHIYVSNIGIENDLIEAALPGVSLYPDLLSIISGKPIKLSSITLTDPRIKIIKTGSGKNNGAPKLPSLDIKIENGTLTTPDYYTGGSVNLPPLSFFSINASLALDPESLALRASGSAPFIEKIYMRGKLDLASYRYDAMVELQGLVLHKDSNLPIDTGGRIAMTDSVMNVKADVHGQGTSNFEGNITGDMPCLLYRVRDEEIPIDCGSVDFFIKKDGRDFAFEVNKLKLSEPHLSLEGVVSRTAKSDNVNNWHIDLTAKKLDLTSIRTTILYVIPDNHIVNLVCDIVRNGEANSATYKFDGPLSDLAHINSMEIGVDVKSSEIHVPGRNLQLFETSGPILIKNGILTGDNLSTRIGKSHGSNGVLMVGLTHEHPGFELDLDIDADFVDIYDALKTQINNTLFQDELARIDNFKGTAAGHLSLNMPEHLLRVGVSINKINGSLQYERTPWPININSGELEIDVESNGVVNWHNVSADLGKQKISRTDGYVNWGEGPVELGIENLEAHLNADDLYKGIMTYPVLKDLILPVLTEIDGNVLLGNGTTLSGPFFEPLQWQYKFIIEADDLQWQSPLLPDDIATKYAKAVLTDTDFTLTDSDNTIASQPISIQGDLRHYHFGEWSGAIDISGILAPETVYWIKKKNWMPATTLPKAPSRIERMRLVWDKQKLLMAGSLRAGTRGPAQPVMNFDVRSRFDNPLTLNLDFTNGEEKGNLELDFLDRKPKTFTFQWHGTLSGKTVSALMADSELLDGDMQGNFRLMVPESSSYARFEGWMKAENLSWYWGKKTELVRLRNLHLQGNDDEMIVKNLDLDFGYGESITTKGSVIPKDNGLMIDFDLSSPRFSMITLSNFFDDLSVSKNVQAEPCEGNTPDWSILGNVDFKVDNFQTGGEYDDSGKQSKILEWQPLIGRVELAPNDQKSVVITAADLCCLNISGVWNSPQTLKDSYFKLSQKCDKQPLFQDTLSCMGIDQDIIEGEFTISGEALGNPEKWRDGKLTIHSDKGRIMRMTLLSKIFSVVNLTDLFVSDDLPDVNKEGFPYTNLDFEATVKGNKLVINKAVVRGKGINLFARGEMDLKDFKSDFTVMIAPFKTLDTIISKIPLIGRVIGGKNATLLTIPVRVTGKLNDPTVIPLSPTSISEGLLNIVKDTLLLPFTIIPSPSYESKKDGDLAPNPLHAPQ